MDHTDHHDLETKITALLQKFSKDSYASLTIAPLVAKRSLLQNHLYQDLGFTNRIAMGHFMELHFPLLAKHKPPSKLWKKYLYDSIDAIAPACEHCSSQTNCFTECHAPASTHSMTKVLDAPCSEVPQELFRSIKSASF